MAKKARSLKMLISKKFFHSKSRSKTDDVDQQSKSSSADQDTNQMKIKTHKKLIRFKESLPLNDMSMAQEIFPNSEKPEAIHVLKFNADGKLLASGGKDKIVYIWVVQKRRHEFEPKNSGQIEPPTEPEIFDPIPLQKLYGHAGDILDLAWSRKSGDNWLISASMDKTVKLWHTTKGKGRFIYFHK